MTPTSDIIFTRMKEDTKKKKKKEEKKKKNAVKAHLVAAVVRHQ